ncbi:MAG: hydrogenase formation protein HypD [Candidatus Hydrothermarchaeales archaeon]
MADIEIHRMFRDKKLAKKIIQKINELSTQIVIMHVCGTHEQSITKFGIRSLLPDEVEVVPGPGCPVCVTPANEIDEAIELARRGLIITVYGDMFRVPGNQTSLAQEKADGADVRIVYSPENAIEIAINNPDKDVVFFAIGLETTTPMTADIMLNDPPENFSVLSSHRLTPPAVDFLLSLGDLEIDGFIDPGHVSTITGVKAWEPLTAKYGVPQVITGFEPLDIMVAILMLLKQMRSGKAKVENEYTRSVTYEGNTIALEKMWEVFEPYDKEWRGFPVVPNSVLRIKKEFEDLDASKKYDISPPVIEGEACGLECPLCGDILRGLAKPTDCELFAKTCTPQNPIGACMVSTEGTCNIAFRYGTTVKL